MLERLGADQVRALCERAAPSRVAPVIAVTDAIVVTGVLVEMELTRASALLTELPAVDACALLRRLPQERRGTLLASFPKDRAAAISSCLSYRADCAGALLDPTVLTLWTDQTVKDALDSVSRSGRFAHSYLFVVDRSRTLVGVADLRSLLTVALDSLVGAVARLEVASVGALADRTEILAHPAWNDFHALPVVDGNGRFLGVLRHETLRRLESGRSAEPAGELALSMALELGELGWTLGCTALDALSSALVVQAGMQGEV